MKFRYRKREFNIDGMAETDRIYHVICKTRSFYEIDLLEYMYDIREYFYRDHSIAIDVGANIGNHSIYFRDFLVDHVIAFEPNTDVVPILRQNLKQNIDHYDLYTHALGETAGKGNIYLPKNMPDNIGSAKIAITQENNGSKNPIDIATLDTTMEQWQQTSNNKHSISLLKIDVEGMELAVLKGAEQTITRHKPHLFLEAVTTAEFNLLEDFLKDSGYVSLSRWAGTPVYHFAHQPSRELINKARRLASLRKIRKLMRKIKRYNGINRL